MRVAFRGLSGKAAPYMRVVFLPLLGLLSCGRTHQDSSPVPAGTGGVPTGNAGSQGAGAAPLGGATSTGGSAGNAGAGTTSAGAGGSVSAGGDGTTNVGAGGVAPGGAAVGDDAASGAGGEGGAIDLAEYACEAYPLGECLDGASNESYACCPLAGDAPCVTGFRTSNGDDFRCGSDSCLCQSENFDASCFGSTNPCRQEPNCETVWQYRHVYQGEHPGAAFNPYYAQIDLLTPNCGTIGIVLDNHRVGSFTVYGLTECWRQGTQVTSKLELDGEHGTLELLAPPKTAPPFAASGARLEIDVYRVSWDDDSLLFDVSWRAVACH